MTEPSRREQIFISYSHKDKKWLEHLQTFLSPHVRKTNISIWDDTKVNSGEEWREGIETAIASAKVAVLLVSPDFLACDFIAEHELSPLLEAAQNDGLRILWIAVRASGYVETEIARYQAMNDPSRPLASLSATNREKELVRICQEIKLTVLKESAKTANPDTYADTLEMPTLEKHYLSKTHELAFPQESATCGSATFDYSNFNGRFQIGEGAHLFETMWTKASDKTIHCYTNTPSIHGIALAPKGVKLSDIIDASALDYSSRVRSPEEGRFVVLKNNNGLYAVLEIIDIKDDSRSDERDELTFRYWIQANGSTDFSKITAT